MSAIILTKDAHISYSDPGMERRKAGFRICEMCRTGDGLHGGGALKRREELRMTRRFLVLEIDWITSSLSKIENTGKGAGS